MSICRKRKHRSPAAARKWLRHKYKLATDAKHIYPCPHHGDELVYHLTRMEQPKPLPDPMTALATLCRLHYDDIDL